MAIPEPPQKSPLVYTGLLLLAVALYVAYLLVSRYESNRAFERRNAENAAEKHRSGDSATI